MNNPEQIQSLGKRIKQLREQKNYSQQELADYADISKRILQKIELGQVATNIDFIYSIAKALKIKPSEFV